VVIYSRIVDRSTFGRRCRRSTGRPRRHGALAALRDLRPLVAATGGSSLQLEILAALAGGAALGRGTARPNAPQRIEGEECGDPESGGTDARLAPAWRRTLPLVTNAYILDSTSPDPAPIRYGSQPVTATTHAPPPAHVSKRLPGRRLPLAARSHSLHPGALSCGIASWHFAQFCR